jgi:type IV pilus assembly protein PilF
MMRVRSLIAAALLASMLFGCATQSSNSDIGLDRMADNGSDSGSGVSEQGVPRERAKAHTDLAGAYYQLGNLAVALDELRIAIGADPNYAQAYSVLGLVHAELRENPQAAASFERALRIDPGDPDINHNYAWFLCNTGREELSLRYFMAAVRNPLYATPQKSYTLAATCALRKNLDADAVTYYDRALRLDPTYSAALIGFAQLRFRRGEIADSKTLVDQFNRVTEPTSESLWLALRIARALGDRPAEASYTGQLRRLFAGSPEYQKLVRGQYD